MSSFERVVDDDLGVAGFPGWNRDRRERIGPEAAKNPSGAAGAPNSSILS